MWCLRHVIWTAFNGLTVWLHRILVAHDRGASGNHLLAPACTAAYNSRGTMKRIRAHLKSLCCSCEFSRAVVVGSVGSGCITRSQCNALQRGPTWWPLQRTVMHSGLHATAKEHISLTALCIPCSVSEMQAVKVLLDRGCAADAEAVSKIIPRVAASHVVRGCSRENCFALGSVQQGWAPVSD